LLVSPELEIKILQTELQRSILTEEQIIFWIGRFKSGDVNDAAFRRAIIDIFVNAIYLYDDRIVFTYNYKTDSRTINIDEVEVSDLPKCAPPESKCTSHASVVLRAIASPGGHCLGN
jgi:hypothetical protein